MDTHDHSHPDATIDRALAYVERRIAAFDPGTAMLIHGDAHPGNMVEIKAGADGRRFKLIDPEGLISERAHELGIPLRAWSQELMAGGSCGCR